MSNNWRRPLFSIEDMLAEDGVSDCSELDSTDREESDLEMMDDASSYRKPSPPDPHPPPGPPVSASPVAPPGPLTTPSTQSVSREGGHTLKLSEMMKSKPGTRPEKEVPVGQRAQEKGFTTPTHQQPQHQTHYDVSCLEPVIDEGLADDFLEDMDGLGQRDTRLRIKRVEGKYENNTNLL